MKKTWQAFWRLGGGERILVLEAAAMVLASWLGLRLIGFRRWRGFISHFASAARIDSPPVTGVESGNRVELSRKILRLEASASRHLFIHLNCLERSLTLWWLLHRRGINAKLRIGGRKENGRFEAHAWVDLDGIMLSETDSEHNDFIPFERPASPMENPTR